MSETAERVSAGYMTPADFPHGTPAGAELGCKNGCPGADAGQTCEQAAIRYRGDFAYRKLVDGGATVEVLSAPELFGKVVKPKKVKERVEQPTPIEDISEVPKLVESEPLGDGVDPVKDERPTPEHGTTARHARGCKKDEECPGDPTTGVTCRRALLDYQADWRRKKKEEAADNAAIDAAAGVVPVSAPIEAVLEVGEKVEPLKEAVDRFNTPVSEQDGIVPVEWVTQANGESVAVVGEPEEVVEPLAALAWPVDISQESPLAPPSESLALAVVRTQLADLTEQRQIGVDALARATEANVQLQLELDVAKEKASRIPHVEYRDFPRAEKSYAEGLVIDPTEAGGVRVDLSGLQGSVSLSLTFAEHGLSDVYLTVGDDVATQTLEQAA